MCGIAGVARADRTARIEPELLAAMAAVIAHRGPDDEGFHFAGGVGLAHRRLSIIDVGNGRQPLANEDGSVVVVFNGEIYNYAELTAGLEARGHRFRTRSDTETIVHRYEERGAGCVEDFRGMFAFALWDEPRRRLLLARDRLGIKPLYYYAAPGLLVFGSEIKSLLEHPEVPRELDPEALELYLALRYVPGPRTLFRGIQKLQPGHLLVWDDGELHIRRYWDLPREGEGTVAPAEARERFSELLDESVRLRLVSEVPLGVFLSGGLDSTAILATMSRVAPGRRFKTFTVGYQAPSGEDDAANELGWARMAAEAYGAEHHELRLSDDDFRDFLPELVWHLDEPVADPACVPLYYISRLARDEITVVLSGEGADEILGGYGIYRRMLGLERAHRLLGGPLAPLTTAAAGLLPGERLRHAARLAALPLEERYRGVSRGFLPEQQARLLGREAGGPGGGAGDPVAAALAGRYAAVAGGSALERMLYLDATTWLPDDLLVKADKMTMANSQELRVPFLDHRMVELAATLGPEHKIRGGRGKVLLRETMAGRVPRPILERSKQGFPVPTVPLLRRLGGLTRELLLGRDAACRAWFDPAAVARLVDEHERGAARRDQELWSLLVFELWHGTFLDRRFAPARPGEARAAAAGGAS
ncbi:MAG TPA: asparagine synthase (glutamine-hydrolyzing) [Thermoanaerobaculia bacterium]|nr:asparagine synthase (glutamine-hydrolyzing) [Thermoanaerobaculia bacterium]